MKKGNGGFSLVELIVAMAIMAIAGISIFRFMSYSSDNYKRSNEDVKLQYEQQLAVNQIRDLILESSRALFYDESSKTLIIYSQSTDSAGNIIYPVIKMTYKQDENKIYFGTKDFLNVSGVSITAITDEKILAENVSKFTVDLSKVKKNKVTFHMAFEINGKKQEVEEVVALRNKLLVSDETDTIYTGSGTLKNSFIKSVELKRGSKSFSNGGTDEIGKHGEAVSIQYTASVIATEDSERDYAVSWNLKNAPVGVSVSNGMVTVASSVMNGRSFELHVTSVDDPDKDVYITITVTNNGIYPESAKLELKDTVEGNGYRQYVLLPTLLYTDGSASNDPTLFEWHGIDSLPGGGYFNKETGVLNLTETANNYVLEIYVVAKEKDTKGQTIISNKIVITVGTIPPYKAKPSVDLSVPGQLNRGGYVFPTISFKNAINSNYKYHWEIEKYNDADSTAWGSVNNSSFDLVSINISGNNDYNQWNVKHSLDTTSANRSITLSCSEKLNWNKAFKIKVSAYATDSYGNVLYAESKYVTIEPVAITLIPTSDMGGWGTFSTDTTLSCENQYNGQSRWFTISCDYLYMTSTNFYNLGCYLENKYVFYNTKNVLVTISNRPEQLSAVDRMSIGFKAYPANWYIYNNRPVKMNYALYVSDKSGNSATSNIKTFYMDYTKW